MSESDPLCFVDTNILIYAHDLSTGIKHELALNLVDELQAKKAGCSSIQVMQEFHVTATQKIARPITIEQSLAILLDLSTWRIHAPTSGDVIAAVVLQQHYRLSYWDAMIVRSAIASGCKYLYSEDLSHEQKIEGMQIINPFKEWS